MRLSVLSLVPLLLAALLFFAAVPSAHSEAPTPPTTGPILFDFADPAKENAVALSIDSPLKPIVGFADGISGSARFDPMHPEATTGTIRVSVASIRFSNEGYSASARGYGLNGDRFSEIVCELKKIEAIRKVGEGAWEGRVAVDFTMKGTTRRLSVPGSVRYFPGRAQERDGRVRFGDLLVVRSTFTVSRAAYKVAEEVPPAVCGDTVEVRVAVVGTHARPEPAAPPKPPTASSTAAIDPLDARLPEIAERMRVHHVPGATVAVVRDFHVVWTRSLGTTGENGAPPVDNATLFPAGAMGEPIADVIALRLIQQKRLRLEEDINTHLKTWKVPDTSARAGRPVTLRNLLAHRSGFTLHKYKGYPPGAPIPTLLQVLASSPPAQTPPAVPVSVPGAEYCLAGENYTVLQQLTEDVTGKSWAELYQEEIVTPLGGDRARSTYAVLRPTGNGTHAALGHADDGAPLPGGGRAYPELAASGLWTTIDQYAAFLADALSCIAARPNGRLLNATTARLLLTQESEDQKWAFGYYQKGGTTYLFRGGNTAGYYCHLDADPERGNAIIVMTNRDLCWQFANEARDLLSKTERWTGY